MKVQSSLGRKQRKAHFNQPWHERRKKMGAHLDTKLMEKYHIRSLPVRKGDTVKILRGDADVLGHEAKVAKIDITHMRIVVEGITAQTAKGKAKERWVNPSNVMIIKLDLTDPLRRKRIEKRGKLAEGALKAEADADKAAAEKESAAKAPADGAKKPAAEKMPADAEGGDDAETIDDDAEDGEDAGKKPEA